MLTDQEKFDNAQVSYKETDKYKVEKHIFDLYMTEPVKTLNKINSKLLRKKLLNLGDITFEVQDDAGEFISIGVEDFVLHILTTGDLYYELNLDICFDYDYKTNTLSTNSPYNINNHVFEYSIKYISDDVLICMLHIIIDFTLKRKLYLINQKEFQHHKMSLGPETIEYKHCCDFNILRDVGYRLDFDRKPFIEDLELIYDEFHKHTLNLVEQLDPKSNMRVGYIYTTNSQ